MKQFKSSCIDKVTGYEMVLAECSYNLAMEWLFSEVKKLGYEICRQFQNKDTGLYEVWTAQFDEKINNYRPTRHFYYDETRGYLLGN